ncbi:hypothetical protein HHI36_002345 [Cryptolaemus montrouzieri]|uniref:Uncharacterized protein n=1 Tax=Cryptolaemus montrouzieri TaxID=559131 RepID=A0ABD2PAX7_9CUCU
MFLSFSLHCIVMSFMKKQDVKAFMDFVKTSNGHENGWAISDHQLFLKLRKKCKNVGDVALNLNEVLPDISVDEVKKHEIWYARYLNLKEKHHEALRRWQKMKEEIKTNESPVVDQLENPGEFKTNSSKYLKIIEKRTFERKKIKEDIESWKKEREIMEKIQMQLKEEKNRQAKLKEKKTEEMKRLKSEMVKQWKTKKLASEQEQKNTVEVQNDIEHNIKVSVANKMIKLYQMQDKIIVDKKEVTV